MKDNQQTESRAIGQRSMGPGMPEFPMFPVLLGGCPVTASDRMQYPLELDYDYDAVARVTFRRGATWEDWAEILPPRHPRMNMPVGATPLVDISEAAPVSLRGRGVFVKDESRNPTWSHKDRLNTFTIGAALYEGADTIIVASSGNHGVSAAAMASRARMRCIVLTMPEVSPAFCDMIIGFGAAPVFLEAEDRWPAMRALQTVEGTYPVSNLTPFHTGHPWGTEGYKTIAYEILADLGGQAPAAVVVPTGYGEMLYGIHKGFVEARRLGHIDRIPQLISVEPAARGPLHHALKQSLPATVVTGGPTIQSGTGTTVGGYRSTVAIRDSAGLALLIDDDAARAAHASMARMGLWQEFSSSAALAALDQIETLQADGPIVLMGCSTGLKEPPAEMKVTQCRADLPSLRAYLARTFDFQI